MVDLPQHKDVYSVVERNYDMVDMSFHESYDSTDEFAAQLDHFTRQLPDGGSVLVVGGSVSECTHFRDENFVVTNLDISSRMAEHVALSANVHSVKGNVLTLTDGSFDGVWACRSLIHLHPDDFVAGLKAVRALLKDTGIFSCALFTCEETFQQQAVTERHANESNVVYYRCLYSQERVRGDFAAADFRIVDAIHCVDRDDDPVLFIEAVSSGA